MTTDDFKPEEWTYAGRRQGANVATVDVYYSDDGKERAFKAERRPRTIGGVYKVMVSPDGSKARVSTATFIRMSNRKDDVAAWRTLHDAYESERELAGIEAKGKDLHLSCLEPIRAAYRKAPFTQRPAIELAIIRYLRRA